MSEIKFIDIAEFREVGYLQELNRRFLHPLGLAMEVTVVKDDGSAWIEGERLAQVKSVLSRNGAPLERAAGIAREVLLALHPPRSEFLSGVWDSRDDPEGFLFEGLELVPKAARIDGLWSAREPARVERLGYVVQPAETT